MINLDGKTALVCGASQGIGQAAATQLAESGARVIAFARNMEKLEEAIRKLPGPPHHVAFAADMADRDSLERSLDSALDTAGPIEILVCNTGGPKAGPLSEAEDEEFLGAFQNHVLASSFMVKRLLPGMKEKCYGRIINVISTSVKTPIPNLGVSNTIRGAVANWAKTLSLELGPYGITVNNVLPGYTMTPRLTSLLDATAQKRGVATSVIAEEWKCQIPLRRFAHSTEVAAAICFLASPAASYINGINLPVDGGRTPSL